METDTPMLSTGLFSTIFLDIGVVKVQRPNLQEVMSRNRNGLFDLQTIVDQQQGIASKIVQPWQ
jgi:hypothetical protein